MINIFLFKKRDMRTSLWTPENTNGFLFAVVLVYMLLFTVAMTLVCA